MSTKNQTFDILAKRKTFLTVPEIAREAGYTRAHMWTLARSGEIPAPRANPEGKHHRYVRTPELMRWCKGLRLLRESGSIRPSPGPAVMIKMTKKLLGTLQKGLAENPIEKMSGPALVQFASNMKPVLDDLNETLREVKLERARRKSRSLKLESG